MIFEHWIYSVAVAIVFGMFYYRLTGRDYSWIIILSAYVPDIDFFYGGPVVHGDFHNVGVLFFYAVSMAFLLRFFGVGFLDSFIYASVGFAAHLFEDALVLNPGYCFFWPLSSNVFTINVLQYTPDLYCISDSRVLAVGLILVALCAILRTLYEGRGWVGRMFGFSQ